MCHNSNAEPTVALRVCLPKQRYGLQSFPEAHLICDDAVDPFDLGQTEGQLILSTTREADCMIDLRLRCFIR